MKVYKLENEEEMAKKHKEKLQDTERKRLSDSNKSMLMIIEGIATYMFIDADWRITVGIGLGLFGIMCAIVGVLAARKVGTAQDLYDRYPLAPATIVEVNERDMVLMALVNTNVDPKLPPRWAATLRTVS